MIHLHWYHVVCNTGVHHYLRCRCGKRKIVKVAHAHQPIDRGWLETGEWTPFPSPPRRVIRKSNLA